VGANNDGALISESRTDNLFRLFRRGPGPDQVSIGKSLRCVSQFVSHRSHTKVE